MPQTPEGSKKARATLLAKDPDYFKKLGKLGGKAKVPKGFAKMDKDRLSEVSSRGGSMPRKRSKKAQELLDSIGYEL